MSAPVALRVGDVLPQGRVVGIQESTPNLRGFAWVERRCADGTVERETFYLDELSVCLPRWALLEANRRVREGLNLNPAYERATRDRIAREIVREYGTEASLRVCTDT